MMKNGETRAAAFDLATGSAGVGSLATGAAGTAGLGARGFGGWGLGGVGAWTFGACTVDLVLGACGSFIWSATRALRRASASRA